MFFSSKQLSRLGTIAIAIAAALLLLGDVAEARVGGGRSFGSRGDRTFSTPPATNTAPRPAAPMERSMTQPGQQTAAKSALPANGAAPLSSRFGGLGGLLMGGLIGAGLASLFGFGAFANVLGFLLQMALIGGIVWLALAFFRNRRMQQQPAMAGGPGSAARPDQASNYRAAPGGSGRGGADPALQIRPADFDAFERLLGEIQVAYGRGDMKALGDRTTPEMLSYFAEELDANAKKGVRNEVSAPKLLQGDLSEAWREAGGDYATVAMRYSLLDKTVEIASGRVVSGSATAPQEVTEVWTFRRPRNGKTSEWELSAVQQVS